MRMACVEPRLLESDDLEYTQEVITPLLANSDRPTVIAALFGDAAARQLGYSPLGLCAGLESAAAMAQKKSPVTRLPERF